MHDWDWESDNPLYMDNTLEIEVWVDYHLSNYLVFKGFCDIWKYKHDMYKPEWKNILPLGWFRGE